MRAAREPRPSTLLKRPSFLPSEGGRDCKDGGGVGMDAWVLRAVKLRRSDVVAFHTSVWADAQSVSFVASL